MSQIDGLLLDITKNPEDQTCLSQFLDAADFEHREVMQKHFPSFRETLSKSGFSNDHSVATLQIGVLNSFMVNSDWRYSKNEGPFSDQIDAILGFLSNNLGKSTEHFNRIMNRTWQSILVEYYFRLLAISPGDSTSIETMRKIGSGIELISSNLLGVFLLPATLAATLSRYALANELLEPAYRQIIKPHSTVFYPEQARFAKSSERFSYKTEGEQRQIFLKYFKEMRSFISPLQNDSMMINYIFAVEIMKYLKSDRSAVKALLNFRSTYGWLESTVHRNFRDIDVIGYDESVVSKELNEKIFGATGNLRFVCGDFWDFFEKEDRDETMLLNCRTGTLLDYDSLLDFYRRLARNRVPAIGIAEHFRFSKNTGKFLDQDSVDFVSENKTGTGVTRLHNYKKALVDSGYKVVIEKSVPDVSYRGINVLALGEYVYVEIEELN